MCYIWVCMYTKLAVQWHINAYCGRHICSEPYVSNVLYMHASAADHISYCIEFIQSIEGDRVVLCAHNLIGISGLYVEFEWQITFWHLHVDNMFPVTLC